MVYSAPAALRAAREPDPRRGRARLRVDGRTDCSARGGAVLGPLARVRRRARRRERLPPPRGGPPVGRLLDRRATSAPPTASRSTAAASTAPQSLAPGDAIELGTSRVDFELECRVELDPIAVALKFGFLAVLYLFLLWVARSALKDLRRGTEAAYAGPSADRGRHGHARRRPRLDGGETAVRRSCGSAPRRACAPGPPTISAKARSLAGATRRTSGSRTLSPPRDHARLVPQGDVMVLEDLGSTNGTYLNGEPLRGPQPCTPATRSASATASSPSSGDRCCGSLNTGTSSDLGRQRQGNEDNYFVRAPALRRRRRHGRRPGGRGRVRDGRRGLQLRLARRRPREGLRRRSSRRPTGGSTRGRGPRARRAWARRSPPPTSASRGHDRPRRRLPLLPGPRRRARRGSPRDHSLVGELVGRGKLTEEQAEMHPQRSVITRALGPGAGVQVDTERRGPRRRPFLVCSDGLTSMVRETELKPLLLGTPGRWTSSAAR